MLYFDRKENPIGQAWCCPMGDKTDVCLNDYLRAAAIFFFLWAVCAFFKNAQIGPAKRTDEYVPAIKPTINGMVNWRIDVTPKMNSIITGSSVVMVVLTERDSV